MSIAVHIIGIFRRVICGGDAFCLEFIDGVNVEVDLIIASATWTL